MDYDFHVTFKTGITLALNMFFAWVRQMFCCITLGEGLFLEHFNAVDSACKVTTFVFIKDPI